MRVSEWMAGAAIAVAATMAGAQAPAPSAAPTVQQAFDAAAALDAGKDADAAVAAWTALEARVKPGSRSQAIVMVRKGGALFRAGKVEDADAALRRGLGALPTGDASLAHDRALAYLLLGTVAHSTLDYAGAASEFEKSEAAAQDPVDKLRAALALVQVQAFVDPAAAARALQRTDGYVAGLGKVDKQVSAVVARRRTLLALNTGDFAAARTSALASVAAMGGLTERTSIDDVEARGDAALALILLGQRDKAREYMAMTGAGRQLKGGFGPGEQVTVPDCGGEAELKPADVAVVQFSIRDDGTVGMVEPVYAAGGGRVALEFARAVRSWYWSPEELASIPAFYRYNVRVEMRCSTAFSRPSIYATLDGGIARWLTDQGLDTEVPADQTAATRPGEQQALTQAAAKDPQSLQTLRAAWTLANNPTLPREERTRLYQQALAVAVQRKAPVMVRLALDLPARVTGQVDPSKMREMLALLTRMLAEPDYSGDAQAQAAIRMIGTDYLPVGSGRTRAMLDWLRPIAADARLAKTDSYRVGALVRIASAEQRAGDLAAARTSFAASGLSADQCAVLDSAPKLLNLPGSDAFPREAQQWGFEGWTQVQYDIRADGRTDNVRTLLSYPAFVFSKAASDVATQARFEKTFRPDGGLGCGGSKQRVLFRLPNG
ncbi:hypothetical protein GCM10011380_25300 [Sphingomonas metalli]|uniref:TonB C-terminal domain-containing protein n=1 Tax=Sphingomonas metalli TaxID=1779358 RepID=A0A916WW72_9SPHN|nr:energy transducer TonB [Sphingomonas metalli]GGB34804.1 hypothetical protein GCM10011380_25300 [Sphingomonas metalli]